MSVMIRLISGSWLVLGLVGCSLTGVKPPGMVDSRAVVKGVAPADHVVEQPAMRLYVYPGNAQGQPVVGYQVEFDFTPISVSGTYHSLSGLTRYFLIFFLHFLHFSIDMINDTNDNDSHLVYGYISRDACLISISGTAK